METKQTNPCGYPHNCTEQTTNHSNQFYLKSRPTKTHYQTIFCISKFIDPATK